MDELAVEMEKRHAALGRVVETSAMLEHGLRSAFCALVGSKYAAIVAAAQNTVWLIEQCEAIMRVHRDISGDQRAAILRVLADAKQVNGERNRMVHHVWTATGKSGALMFGSQRRKHQMTVSGPVRHDTLADLAGNLTKVSVELHGVIFNALGPNAAILDNALSWEDQRMNEA